LSLSLPFGCLAWPCWHLLYSALSFIDPTKGFPSMPNFLPYTKHQLDHALKLISEAIYTSVAGLAITAFRTTEPVPFARRQSGEKLQLKVGDAWGDLFDCAWFHFTGQVPAEATGQKVVLLLDVSGEMCVFDENGVPERGLTTVASDYDYSLGGPGKRVFPISAQAQGSEKVDLWVDAGANDLFGNLRNNGRIVEASIAICHEAVRSLFYDFEVLLDFLKMLPPDSARYQKILTALNDSMWSLASGFTTPNTALARQRPYRSGLALANP
jgi:alpha-mannosidase